MHLKRYLRTDLTESAQRMRERAGRLEQDAQAIERIRFNKADYTVSLDSLWIEDGEKSTKTEHRGTIQEAIKLAEAEFKLANDRSDIQANYGITVRIGEGDYQVPKQYWEKFTERERAKESQT